MNFAKNKLKEKKYKIVNLDLNFICETPKIKKYANQMIINICNIINQ